MCPEFGGVACIAALRHNPAYPRRLLANIAQALLEPCRADPASLVAPRTSFALSALPPKLAGCLTLNR